MTSILIAVLLLFPVIWLAVFALIAADKPWQLVAHTIALGICGFSLGFLL